MRPVIVQCVCGAQTIEVFVRRDGAGGVASCWIALDDQALARPGCSPDEHTNEVIERRNARLLAASAPSSAVPTDPRDAQVRCGCRRLTRVHTSNIRELREPPHVEDPPDPRVPVGPTSCWLAIAGDGGPEAGCAPDARTWDVLERAHRGHRPTQDVELEEHGAELRPSTEDMERFGALLASASPAGETKTPVADDEPEMLSLFAAQRDHSPLQRAPDTGAPCANGSIRRGRISWHSQIRTKR
jgi:hypothetical protein